MHYPLVHKVFGCFFLFVQHSLLLSRAASFHVQPSSYQTYMNNFVSSNINLIYHPCILSIFNIMPTIIQNIKRLFTLRLCQRGCAWELLETNISQPTSRLCALPAELIEYIAVKLELDDLCLLRLVCKNLSRKTLHYFGSTYFAYVRTDLSRTSLQKLQQLSRHEKLGHHVRTLLIKGPHGMGRGHSWDRSLTFHTV
jgi:hypothetical protein